MNTRSDTVTDNQTFTLKMEGHLQCMQFEQNIPIKNT